jgi:hypothetical protein
MTPRARRETGGTTRASAPAALLEPDSDQTGWYGTYAGYQIAASIASSSWASR